MQRPMFKLGGKAASQGTGITSGLDEKVNMSDGRANYADGPDLRNKYLTSALDKIERREAAMDGLNDLYNLQAIAGASNLAGQITTNNPFEAGLQLLRGAPSIVLPLMSQRKKLELQKLDPKTDLALAKAFKTSGGFGEKVYRMKLRDLTQLESRLNELNQQKAAGEIDDANYKVAKDAIERRLKLISSQFQTSTDIRQMLYNQYLEQNQIAPDKETLDELVAEYKAAMGNSMGGTPNRVDRMMGSPETGEMADDPKPLPSDPTEPVNPFKPKPIKPLGDMADKGNDTYAMLRARLPAEIPDDVVSLISYNPEAFADFASIENQEDVKSFNEKYGMELVIDVATV